MEKIKRKLRAYARSVGYRVSFSDGEREGTIAGCDGNGLPLIQYEIGSDTFYDYGKGKNLPL